MYNPGRQIASAVNPNITDDDCEYRIIMKLNHNPKDIEGLCAYIKVLLQQNLPDSWENISVNYSTHYKAKTCMGAKYKKMEWKTFWNRLVHWHDYNFYYYARTGKTEPKIMFHEKLPIEDISSIPIFP